jgi:hypothetical protein
LIRVSLSGRRGRAGEEIASRSSIEGREKSSFVGSQVVGDANAALSE